MSGISQTYQLRFQIGEQDVSLVPSSMNRFEITEYLDRFLPTIYCDLNDGSGLLTHLTTHDSRFNTLTVNYSNIGNQLSSDDDSDDQQSDVTFKIFRRKPESVQDYANNILFEGILDIQNMFNPNYQRGWINTPISDIIADVLDETTFDNTNIDVNISVPISIIQPNWTNAQFLNYLSKFLKSDSGECGFLVFCDIPDFQQTRLNFTSLSTLLKQQSVYTYMSVPSPSDPTIYPIFKYGMIDNYDLISHLGVAQQNYGYFDYLQGKYITRSIPLSSVDFVSLSSYFAYDTNDNIQGLSQSYLGITDDFISDYDGLARGLYYKKINSLVKMWITSIGNNDLNPGDIIKVIFPETGYESNITPQQASIASYQYSGYWLVERIKHQFGATYTNHILLTRPGFDSDLSTTFLTATNVKK